MTYQLGALRMSNIPFPTVEALRQEITDAVNELGVYKISFPTPKGLGKIFFFKDGYIQTVWGDRVRDWKNDNWLSEVLTMYLKQYVLHMKD